MILISYDLNGNRKNYDGLFDAIKHLGDWCHCLKSDWLIYTNKTPQQVYESLRLCLDNDDYLLVNEVNLYALVGWLPKDASDWVNARVPAYR